MVLRSIILRNFRNYREELFTFHERFNLICGDNAQGKTNLLEAIHLLSTFRPFKQIRIEELIQFGQSQGRIKGEIESNTGLNDVHINLAKGGKTVRLNGKVIYSLSKVVGKFNVVTFLPSDLELIKGTPQNRRKYVDTMICTFSPQHLTDLKSYFRALSQRNALLAKRDKIDWGSLEIWDEKMAELGARIIGRRINSIRKLQPEIREVYKRLSGIDTEIKFHYRSAYKLGKNIDELLKNELSSRITQDKRRGHTTVGPHRDLIEFRIDGKDAAEFASQGEAKTLALALKSSEIELTRKLLGRTPVLLLDDIISELDEKRRKFLFGLLEGFTGQVFVTATSANQILYKKDKKIFHIKAGSARPISINEKNKM